MQTDATLVDRTSFCSRPVPAEGANVVSIRSGAAS